MHQTKIGIFKIAQTRVDWTEVKRWLEFIGVLHPDVVQGQLKTGTDASQLIALCGKRCYASFDTESGLNPNVTKIRTDHAEYVTNILASGHGSVLEHATWSFAIENVSRVFTGEMNRHRAGVAISEASMRYVRFDDIGYCPPDTVAGPSSLLEELLSADMTSAEVQEAQQITQELFDSAFRQMEQWNLTLTETWRIDELKNFKVKKVLTSMFRRLIGMGVSTGGVWTINARALRHILAMRASTHAEEEILHVFSRVADIMIADEPLLFGDFQKTENGWVPKYPKV